MRLLYGRNYVKRYRLVSRLLPDKCSVVELCCGCGYLYEKFLATRGIRYVGVDMLERMLKKLKSMGVKTVAGDALFVEIEKADYCIMLGSLYHFFPKEDLLLQRMTRLGQKAILLEPIINYTHSSNFLIAYISRILSYIKGTSSSERINSEMLDVILMRAGVTVLLDKVVLDGFYRLIIFQKNNHT
ncbi:class I SAM-dependent methyltransferase [Polynucleobacter sp. AP-Jannik-300A-C4]|uniref:class I SAM-dependent methyltransferase n=1 Tax=Polynucleobacter sp. AP-Jannik-300A-C4 TaxID=2576928 RepID=UPI001BFD55FF|nr:class I SAM-dependent methyltransferase [Polynucleobacter sp. AP-Jannik-300A-C4]QWE22953.1 class I SAM-dependent methyltransferase [Polynucleobacter sp. AP-Jannik-300A-C4]